MIENNSVKEYWINVYKDGSLGMAHYSKDRAIKKAAYHLAYRIHVILK